MQYILKKIKVGQIGTNCYIFGDNNTNEVVVVDPGYEASEILDVIEQNNYNVRYIVLTHGHFDHIGAVKFLKQATSAKILIHEKDSEMLINSQKNLSAYANPEEVIQVQADKFVKDEQIIDIGNKKFKIISTPGHTMGGICLLFEDSLFSGDTLFRETIGRTDLPSSNHSDIIKSVNKLAKLDDNTKVYPGHGPSSTIGYERKNNPYLK